MARPSVCRCEFQQVENEYISSLPQSVPVGPQNPAGGVTQKNKNRARPFLTAPGL
jgi:hypothetical protein